MKLLILLTTVACLQVSANGFGQTLSLSLANAPLEQAFKEIKKQTGYSFVYIRDQLKNTQPVNCQVKNAELKEVLDICFRNQPLTFVIEDHYIVVQTKSAVAESSIAQLFTIDISGRVINENGEALPGVTITSKNSDKATSTNEKGEFSLKGINDDDVLIITSVGYYKEEIQVNKQNIFFIRLRISVGSLDETIVIAYGTTTRRLNTGSVSKVTSEEISKQPVSNPLATIQGRVPGLIITQTSGIPGSAFKVQIRGQNSIGTSASALPATDPLYIIDGVPFAPGNNIISRVSSAANNPYQQSQGGLSPFSIINPADIESIEVLKDADATAIYGSRGANGVILITTKKGKAGKTKISASIYRGSSKVTRTMNILDTKQYLQMRREAFANDGITPDAVPGSPGYAPDLMIWDTTRYTNFKKELIGGTSNTLNLNISASGGSNGTQFLVGAGYYHETTVFPGDLGNNRVSVNSNLSHTSENKKFNLLFSTIYSSSKNNLSSRDLTSLINLPPNAPLLYDYSTGKLNWSENAVSISDLGFENPFAYLQQKYTAKIDNVSSSLQTGYHLFENFIMKSSFGYNKTIIDEISIVPISSQDPIYNPLGRSYSSYGTKSSWIIEPQAEYTKKISKGKLSALVGATWQENLTASTSISADGFTSDALLRNQAAASALSVSTSNSKYRYTAVYARLNYNWQDKYILNLTGRRDGSSRFGPERQFGNFGATGVAWLFSNEDFFKRIFPFVSYGKLRGSYGITGNDNIGDYQYLDSWTSTTTGYQGVPGLRPSRLSNPEYNWEINRKYESALELGFFKNRILATISYYRNVSGNQLVSYPLPIQSGFNSIIQNLSATIQNKGLEFTFNSKNITGKNFKWESILNVSFNRNKLLAFPNLAATSYSSVYVIGKSLNVTQGFQFKGVDPTTGVYEFIDKNGDGTLNSKDYIVGRSTEPKYYGGLQNSFSYKAVQLDMFFEFKKQLGRNYLSTQGYFIPGFYYNQPKIVLNRWQKNGDVSNIQEFTTSYNGGYFAAQNLNLSEAIYSDASYIRLKNISLSFNFRDKWMKKLGMETGRIYLQAQNIFTITRYTGTDPETQNFYILPPLKTIVAGIQLTL